MIHSIDAAAIVTISLVCGVALIWMDRERRLAQQRYHRTRELLDWITNPLTTKKERHDRAWVSRR